MLVKASKNNLMAFPENLLDMLGIKDGERVEVQVKKGSLVITRGVDDFLALEGCLMDADIDGNIKALDKDWEKWHPITSL